MLMLMLSSKTLLVIGFALSGLVALVTPKRVRGAIFFAGMLITLGVVSLRSGRVFQEWDGGPPLEGSLAVIFSLVLIGIGVYLVLFALLKRTDAGQRDDDEGV